MYFGVYLCFLKKPGSHRNIKWMNPKCYLVHLMSKETKWRDQITVVNPEIYKTEDKSEAKIVGLEKILINRAINRIIGGLF